MLEMCSKTTFHVDLIVVSNLVREGLRMSGDGHMVRGLSREGWADRILGAGVCAER